MWMLLYYFHVKKEINISGSGLYNSLRHMDSFTIIKVLTRTSIRKEARRNHEKRGNIVNDVAEKKRTLCWFIHGPNWKILPSPLSVSLYSSSKEFIFIRIFIFLISPKYKRLLLHWTDTLPLNWMDN